MSIQHRIVVIGVGSIGERHLRCFQNTGRAKLSLVEVNPKLRQTIAERYQIEQAFDSLDAAIAARPHAAVICTPAWLHIPMATQLAKAGVHLLIEKPLSTSRDGVDELQQLIEKHSIRTSVAYVYRSHPLLQAAREAIRSGRFGRPVELVAVCGQHFPTYRPAYREIYYNDRATGGGAIQDALTHVINAGEWLVGPAERVVADAAHQVLDGVKVEDTVHLLARHGGVLASYSLNQYQAPNEVTITVVCERGTVRCEFHQNRWLWMTEPGGTWQIEAITPLERDTLFVTQANRFLDLLEGRADPACTLADGAQTLRVNLAALASASSQSWQTV